MMLLNVYKNYLNELFWPEADMFKDPPKNLPLQQFQSGTKFFHGTRFQKFSNFKNFSWFTTSESAAIQYARNESNGNGEPRVLEVELVQRIKLIFIPNVKDNKKYEDAMYWLDKIFKKSFHGLGFKRMPDQEKLICSLGYDGFYIEKEDSGFPALMLCNGSNVEIISEKKNK